MSSYKGYVSSWKPNLSPYLSSKTSPAASRYSSRDEVIGSSSDSKAAPRFGSLSSPSSYRPTYSGGTYRSVKRDTPVVPSYTSRWLTSTKEPATKDTGTIKKVAVKPSISNDVTNSSKNKFTKNSQSSTPSENLLSKTKAKEQLSTITRPSITVAKVRIRDVSSSNSSYSTSKSRDASPCEPAKDRYTSSSGYVSSSYSKLYPRSSNKLQVNNFRSRSTSPAVSYLNGSDVAGTYRQNVKQNEDNAKLSTENISSIDETTKMSSTIESLPEANVEMIEVNVVTRGTSPNLCSTSTTHYTRCRRADIAKTIEKTIMRPKRKALTEDKEIQSDRMDDTTKYSRFSSARSTTPWPSYMDNKYNSVSYSRLNMSSNSASSSLSKYSNTSKNAKESTDSGSSEKSVEKSPEKSVSKSSRESSVDSKKSSSISRSNSIKSTSKSEKPKSKSPPVPTSKSTSSSPTKQKVYNSKALLPPQPPKLESPTKVISASCSSSTASSTTNSKWANKDFRKSALNVGQTDRPRKSRTSSASTDSEDNKKLQQKSVSNQMPFSRSDRSPSVSSETSYSSGSNADDVMKNFMKLKISSSSSTTAPITAASNGCAESMQSNSDAVMCENTTKPSDAVQSQTLTTQDSSPHSNESFAKIDNTKLSIVNRVLGPVTKIFKTKSQYLSESHSGSEPDNMISTNDSIKQDTLIDSLLNQTTTTTISNGSKLLNSNNYLADESNWINTTLNEQTTDTQFDKFQSENTTNMKDQLRHIDSDNELPLPWWLNEMENDDTIAEDVTLNQSDNEMTRINNSVDAVDTNQSTPAIPWWMLDHSNSHSDAMKKNCITHVSSGDKAWWLDEDTEESVNDILEAVDTENDNASKFTFKIKKIESGERAWWLCEENTDTVPMEKTHEFDCDDTNNNEKNDNEDVDFWATINESLQSKRATTQTAQTQKQAQHLDQNQYTDRFRYDINANYIPLGDRASPEGLEDMNNRIENGSSPYDNINLSNVESNFEKLFISRHQNIDDVLGKPCHALSPIHLDNDAFEEILPSQVRIHDGTAKNVAIDNEKDNWEYCRQSSQTHSPFRLDDATLQVYKDGDYGAYLDLESSLAEQSEELEGLHSNSRKNSLVVRTQLSVRVHAIIEKLLTSEGRELRRALFSLKQIFQDDKDLVHGFVALGGLNSLVRVGNNSDQNYQNYILRALGQVMLYVDGMNGVMHHSPTIQWLYSLIASKYRLVVKTALKLLLVFVEYVESNCYLLVNAIHVVDAAQDSLPWSNIMRLLKDYENADTELLIYATTLINKTLSGLNDQDSFYDESDFLEQQGMESVIQRYMSRPGTDLDLLDQLQLYDAVLKFEDGETDGIRIPDKSIRKTPRCRSLNANGSDPLERRKSRRHSSDAAPNSADSKCYSPRTPIAIHQTVDEDSSSSINSGELNDVFGVTKGGHENAGVTPGLRRRRERAERQKSFLREQQEAAAAGFRPFDMKDDIINNHGVLVTALPCRLQNDSPPNSIDQPNLNKENDSQKLLNTITDSQPRINENNNLIKTSKFLPESAIDESNYVNLNDITAKCKVISSDFTRNSQRTKESPVNGVEKTNQNHINVIDNKNNLVNNFYLHINSSSTINNAYNATKPIISIVNQKNLNNMAKNSQNPVTTNGNSNNLISGFTTNANGLINNFNANNNNNINSNMNSNGNSVLNDATIDTKSITTNGVDYNKNGLPAVSTTHMNDVNTNGHQIQATNKSGICNNITPQTYVIHNGNGLTNGNNGIKEMPRIDSNKDSENDEKRLLLQIKRDHTVKDLTQKLSSLPINAQEEKTQNRIGDMSGLISKAKEGLAKSKSKGDISRSPSKDQEIRKPEPKKSENELHWEELMKNMTRPLNLCDLDFTDLHSDDDKDDLLPRGLGGSVPPPPPPIGIPPPMKAMLSTLEPPPPNMRQMNGLKTTTSPTNNALIKKNKKTVKLFWKEIREDLIPVHVGKTIWDEIPTAIIDTQKLEHLFESRAKDTISKKQQEMNKNKEIIVLDHKRSNAINIAMTKLPPPRAIKAAILKMDATVVTREGIDKLLNMLPTEEERGKIQEAQMINPELPLGSAEQFLLTLSSISELSARLKLWAFKLDFECSEKEIAEPLMDLKQGLDILRNNKTFKCILSTLLSIGIFLNGAPAKGFQIEYLAKVPEVKDTVHKHSLLHHLCHIVMESSTDTTDLYSEIGSITRASKADFADLAHNITYLESECKASWDRLKLIAKHDCPPQLKQKMVDFLADCAERIIILQIVHRRVINRYRKFLLWLGVPQHRVIESRPNEVCRIISEFALEYRTTRERVHQQLEKKANHRERNKTRGKMIIDVAKFRSKEDRADAELKQLLGSQSPSMDNLDSSCQYIGFRRRRPEVQRSPALKMSEDTFTDGDDEILESLVKTATSTPRTAPRERKRTRNADRKSFKRSRTREGFRSTTSP
ncbi:uncharacterized protein LOC116337370 isoform X3 [Contarinia nasturtii]|uniref:uncharacterized protein LOC116337370 isoform X3 n=1 Tax=Contarinia nasturtii TaxID=265458 RepID=UPI0012D42F07|nr:uncharacterized protein LOC116337370 isoform X3 [Contarinia nasturtii]